MRALQTQPASPPRVFVSSTSFDLTAVRSDLSEFLADRGFVPLLFESAAALPSMDGPTSALSHATQCDLCILIVGNRYGSVDSDTALSYTHAEYRAALDAGRPIFAFVQHDTLVKFELFVMRGADVSFWSTDEISLFHFIREVSEQRTRFAFTSLPDLKRQLTFQLHSYFGYLLRTYAQMDVFAPATSNQWLILGDRYWNAAHFGQAIVCYRRGADAEPGFDSLSIGDNAICYGNLARALRSTGRREEALRVCIDGIGRHPHSAYLYRERSNALIEMGRREEALASALSCTTTFPTDCVAWDSLCYIYDRLGRSTDATKALRRALELDPDNATIRRRMQERINFGLAEPA